jgi:hypothetical protein
MAEMGQADEMMMQAVCPLHLRSLPNAMVRATFRQIGTHAHNRDVMTITE